MRQCMLVKNSPAGTRAQMVWIDVQPSDQGRYVDLKVDNDYDPDWYIAKVYEPERTKEEVSERSRDYRNTRKASDI